MAVDVLADTLTKLARAREQSSACIVSYSDGKDSRVVMDLCLRTFDRVEAFYMYMVPGLEQIELGLAAAEKRYGIKIHQYPHWMTSRIMLAGVYCDASTKREVPEWKLEDVYRLVMSDLQIQLIAMGAKQSDSAWRRRMLAQYKREWLINPIEYWLKVDVLAYLKRHNIPLPLDQGLVGNGVELSRRYLHWCHDTWPGDFKKICEYFPYAEATIWQRKWFGVVDRAATGARVGL